MEENRLAYRRNVLIGSVLTAALLIIYYQLTVAFDLQSGGINFLVNVLIFFAIFVYFGKQYLKTAREPVFTYGKAFGFGVLIALFGTLVFSIYVYIAYKFINPGQIGEMIVAMEENMLKSNQDPEMIEQMSEALNKFMTPFVLALGSLVYYFLLGLIVSLFAAIFSRDKEASNPFKREELKSDEHE